MTKIGRPSLLRDIRYFGPDREYLADAEEVTAFGRRLALHLQANGFSVGNWTHLYVMPVPSAVYEEVKIETWMGAGDLDWWLRFARVSVPENFPGLGSVDRDAVLTDSTGKALCFIRPDMTSDIAEASKYVKENGDKLRFLMKRTTSKQVRLDVSVGINAHPKPSVLEVLRTVDNSVYQVASAPLHVLDDAWNLVGGVTEKAGEVVVSPRNSFTAQLASDRYGGPLRFPLTAFRTVSQPFPSLGPIRRI